MPIHTYEYIHAHTQIRAIQKYVYMCHMYICTRVHMHVNEYISTQTRKGKWYAYVNKYAYTHTWIHAHTRSNLGDTRICVWTFMNIFAYTHELCWWGGAASSNQNVHVYILCVYIYEYACTHAWTYSRTPKTQRICIQIQMCIDTSMNISIHAHKYKLCIYTYVNVSTPTHKCSWGGSAAGSA